jgi:hypothetical protein
MNPVPTAMPAVLELVAVTVKSWLPLFHVKFADPPNAPELLNCTSVFAPPGEVAPPVVRQVKVKEFLATFMQSEVVS